MYFNEMKKSCLLQAFCSLCVLLDTATSEKGPPAPYVFHRRLGRVTRPQSLESAYLTPPNVAFFQLEQ